MLGLKPAQTLDFLSDALLGRDRGALERVVVRHRRVRRAQPDDRCVQIIECFFDDHGGDFGTEAAGAVIRYAFEVLGLNRVFAGHYKRNPASGRILQKIGMTYEGRLRQHVKKWGEYEDMEYYGILKSEFQTGETGSG